MNINWKVKLVLTQNWRVFKSVFEKITKHFDLSYMLRCV